MPLLSFTAAVEDRRTAELWQRDGGRAPRTNIQVVANVVQPGGQIGRQPPRPTRNAEGGARSSDRARQTAAAVLREAGRDRTLEPPAVWLDGFAAIADLEGRGR
jgi:hypothetical protein